MPVCAKADQVAIIICVNDKRGGALELFKQGPRQGDLLTDLKPDTKFTYRIESPGNDRLKVYACLGDVDKAQKTLREVPAAYPRTEAARLASERLAQLTQPPTEGPK